MCSFDLTMFSTCFNSIAKRLSKDFKDVSLEGNYILAKQLCQERKWAWKTVHKTCSGS